MLQMIFKQWAKSRLPQYDGRIYLPTLHHPVTIHRDQWGIAHLSATDRHDLLLAQGFVHAQERLWQMELNRRAATGTLSAIFGKLTLETDRLTRTLGFARLAKHNWEFLPPADRADLEAYAAGVNAWLAICPRLPIEFSLIRHTPQPWTPLDSLAYGRLQMWALTNGALAELVQAQLLEKVGAAKAADLGLRYPENNPATLPGGIEIGGLKLDGLLGPWVNPFQGKGALDGSGRGSNGWVIAPERSATGHAILSNDMHLPIGSPSLWYAMHLQANDGLHVTGFTQPGLPYVLVGHNAHIAWGATLSYVDCEDLFIERLHPQHPTYYELRGEWQPAKIVEEAITIRGQAPHMERVVITQHGPLINGTLTTGYAQPIAYCSMALQPDVSIDGFRLLNEATGWDGFITAVAHIHSPSLNLLYADTQGNIGYYVSGRAPIRAKGDGAQSDGTTPVPGWSGDYEWVGEIPFAEMPHALNPAQGYIVSANHRIAGDAYPHFLGNMWRNGYRARRIEQLILGVEKVSLADCRRFHVDVTHIPGLELVRLLGDLIPHDLALYTVNKNFQRRGAEARSVYSSAPLCLGIKNGVKNFSSGLPKADAVLAWELLREWNGRLTPDSVGGTVYEVFIRQLSEAILAPHFDEPFRHKVLGLGENLLLQPVNEFQGQWLVSLLRILEEPVSKWLPEREQVLLDCLARTTAVLRQQLGSDPANWQWGRLHRITFAHAFGVVPGLGRLFSQGPYPVGGDENTVAQTGIRPDLPYDNNAISISTRLIVNLGDLSDSWGMHPPGQSGHVASPHYGDLIQPWLVGDYYQWAWTAEAVTAVTRHTLTLRPQ